MLKDLAPAEGGASVELIEDPTPSRPPRSTPRRASMALHLRSMPQHPAPQEVEDEVPTASPSRCWTLPRRQKRRPASAWASARSRRPPLHLPLTRRTAQHCLKMRRFPSEPTIGSRRSMCSAAQGVSVAWRSGRYHAALLRAESHPRHAVAGRCGCAPRATFAFHAGGGCGGYSCAGSGAARGG